MCLTGVDYFSTLAYQPSIAFVAAGALAPVATLVLVILTLFGALPMYHRVADMSPYGQGSILILEKLFPRWKGKAMVLSLLGFAATSFVITITLSAADAAAHLVDNPMTPAWLQHQWAVTIVLLLVLGGIFLRGFQEAIGLAVVIVAAYLSLNTVVLAVAAREIFRHPELLARWRAMLLVEHGNPAVMAVMAIILFPKLALGLSGFETGVAVMPLVRGDDTDTEENPRGRIRNTKKLLTAAAVIMSVFLMASSVVSVLLIPAEAFARGGAADGRALAYIAHTYLGGGFGTVFDLVTVAILWFAGASALAGLLNLVPTYLPRYGMAPEWARTTRPLVVIFTAIAILVTIVFSADVDSQAGAYATGVLVLMSSGAVAVAITAWRQRHRWALFASITVVFLYTSITNMIERPEGIKIASVFIVAIVISSLISRTLRSTELRVLGIVTDPLAQLFIDERGPRQGHQHHREPAGHGRSQGVRGQAARGEADAPPDAAPPGALSRSRERRRLGVQRGPARPGRPRGRLQRAARHEPGDSERHRRAAPLHPRRNRQDPARLLRMDRRQPGRVPVEVPGVRRGRHRPGDARGAPAGRGRPPPKAAGACRIAARCGW